MKRCRFVPKRIITDKLRSCGAAKREVTPSLDHWSHNGRNNHAETAICHSENESAQCRASGRRGHCSVSSHCSQQPASFLSFSPPPLCSHHSLSSAQSLQGEEIRGECCLINYYRIQMQTRRVDLITPSDGLLLKELPQRKSNGPFALKWMASRITALVFRERAVFGRPSVSYRPAAQPLFASASCGASSCLSLVV